jgi:hypothetical protein
MVGPAMAVVVICRDNDSRFNAVLIDDGFGQDQSPDTDGDTFQSMLGPGSGPRNRCCKGNGDDSDKDDGENAFSIHESLLVSLFDIIDASAIVIVYNEIK